jgi:hypothetical protein
MTAPGPVADPADAARALWRAVERVHAVVYFAPEVRDALAAVGVPGFWRGYFAARAAPLGPVPAEVVTAVAFGFHPAMVARAVPDVWSRCPPARVLDARRDGAAAALSRIAAGAVGVDEVATAADVAGAAAGRLDVAGRPLAAANRALPLDGSPWARLWQGCTTLREHRGDGHVAALVAAGLPGIDGHVLQVATRPVPRALLQPNRGWSDDEWAAAQRRLEERGWVGAGGEATPAGRRAKDEVEAATDRLAAAAWDGRAADLAQLTAISEAVGGAVDASGTVPYPNPMGLPGPDQGQVVPRSGNPTLGASCRTK